MEPPKRPTACLPCHHRKVRCDAAVTGTPCSRCVSKERGQFCVLLPPRQSARPARTPRARERQAYSALGDVEVDAPGISRLQTETQQQSHSRNVLNQSSGNHEWSVNLTPGSFQPLPSSPALLGGRHPNGAPQTPYAVSEEDVQIQTLHRMTDESQISASVAVNRSGEPHDLEIVEYFDKLNSVSILGEVLGHSQRRRLVQLDLPGHEYTSAQQRELATLDPADRAYLNSQRVFKKPPRPPCDALLRLWFELVYPYTPVLDRTKFYETYARDECSHFLLYALLANIVPYASSDLISAAGYSERNAAQRDWVLKARLIHDFGCERRQMILLQGSVILSSFQSSYAPNKDFRFWLHNAVRIATQMGLHRDNLREDLDPQTHSLCRRIWWMIHSRDVLFNLSGFANTRCIDDSEIDVGPLTDDDWVIEAPIDGARTLLPETTQVHKSYFIQSCGLTLLGAKFLGLARNPRTLLSSSAAQDYADDFCSWRAKMPEELCADRTRSWSSQNVWILFLSSMSYRLECLFYRTARQHFSQSNDLASVAWCKQQLAECVFELDTLVSRSIVHNLVKYMPASFVVCVCNLLAFQIEIALDIESSASRKFTAKARINALLPFFQEAGETWRIAKWTFKVSEWVVKRAGLLMQVDTDRANDVHHQNHRREDWNSGQQQDNSSLFTRLDPGLSNEAASSIDDAFPDHWVQDFLGESLLGQLDNDFLIF